MTGHNQLKAVCSLHRFWPASGEVAPMLTSRLHSPLWTMNPGVMSLSAYIERCVKIINFFLP